MKEKRISRAEELVRRLTDACGLKIKVCSYNNIQIYESEFHYGLNPSYSSWRDCLFGNNFDYGLIEPVPDYFVECVHTSAWGRLRSYKFTGTSLDEIELQMAAFGL